MCFMEKRYQIFISSTFSDLKEERNKVMQTIMSLDCIPAGMELFPAMDEEQFEFIKRIIDDCDYYILMIGARYGSMDESGVSYTEKEYDYAVSKNIPVLAFLNKDISSIPLSKADLKDDLREKLDKFRKKVETGRLVKYWKNADELNAEVAISLPKMIKTYPRTGWVKANLMANSESLQEINELRKENETLRAYKARFEKDINGAIDIADWDEIFIAHFTRESIYPWDSVYDKDTILEFSYTWLEWFKMIAIELDKNVCMKADDIFAYVITEKENIKDYRIHIKPYDLVQIKYQFLVYKVIAKNQMINEDYWTLTKKGEAKIARLMCTKTKKKVDNSQTSD